MTTFYPDHITIDGQTIPAGYSITRTGAVVVFPEGLQAHRFTSNDNGYAAALNAARAADSHAKRTVSIATQKMNEDVNTMKNTENNAATPNRVNNKTFAGEIVAFTGTIEGMKRRDAIQAVQDLGGIAYERMTAATTLLVVGDKPGNTKLGKADKWISQVRKITQEQFKAMLQAAQQLPAPEEQPAAKEGPVAQKEQPAAASNAIQKAAITTIPEKTFIGDMITGKGWHIIFDGNTSRTRIIFDDRPTEEARAALDEARFFFSPRMNSWNKKLTLKARRAALRLAEKLNEIYAA